MERVERKLNQEERLPALDGLRGWGAITVLIFHVFCEGLPVTAESSAFLRRLLPFSGLYAVLVFFVVSGISLSYGYFKRRERQIEGLAVSAGTRYLRLAIPIFAIAVAVHLTMAAGLQSSSTERMPPFTNALNFQSTAANVFRFSFFDVFFNYDSTLSYAGPMWTMSIELIGSFLLFFMLTITSKTAYHLHIILMVALVLLLSMTEAYRFYSLFLFGAVIAGVVREGYINNLSTWIFAVMLAVGVFAPIILPPAYDAWNMVAAIALTLGCIGIRPVDRVLSCNFSRLLGVISFPLYLVHGPILVLVGEPLVRIFGQTVLSRFAIDIAICAISILAAIPMISVNKLAIRTSRFCGELAAYGCSYVRTRITFYRN